MIYRLFAFNLATIPGGFMRIDNFQDNVTSLKEAVDEMQKYRKPNKAKAGTRFMLMLELDSVEFAEEESK